MCITELWQHETPAKQQHNLLTWPLHPSLWATTTTINMFYIICESMACLCAMGEQRQAYAHIRKVWQLPHTNTTLNKHLQRFQCTLNTPKARYVWLDLRLCLGRWADAIFCGHVSYGRCWMAQATRHAPQGARQPPPSPCVARTTTHTPRRTQRTKMKIWQ